MDQRTTDLEIRVAMVNVMLKQTKNISKQKFTITSKWTQNRQMSVD